MPPRRIEQRLQDMVASAAKIRRYISDLKFDAFRKDDKTIDAVLRNLVVIGEAARALPDEFTRRHSEVPWSEVRGMRHVVVHRYFGVSLGIVWKTLTDDLPILVTQLESILERMDAGA